MVFKKIKMKNPKKSFKCLDFSKEKWKILKKITKKLQKK
jgi:hypothetical protein